MTHPRRRLTLIILLATLAVAALPTLWIGAKWQRAITNVDKMIVTPVSLPTATAVPQAAEEAPVALPDEAPEPIPTAVPEPGGAMNILLVGTDARPGDDVSRTAGGERDNHADGARGVGISGVCGYAGNNSRQQ